MLRPYTSGLLLVCGMWDNKKKTMMSQADTPLTPEEEAVSETTSQQRLAELAEESSDLARLVAGNAIAAPELLLRLSTSGDAIVRQNVAANPNTPTQVLLEIADEFPAEVLQNPIFSLLFLENPEFLNKMPGRSVASVLRQDGVPVFFLEWAGNRGDTGLRLVVAMNANTPKTVLEKLRNNHNAQVREAVEMHVNIAGEMSSGWDEEASTVLATTSGLRLKGSYLLEIAEIGLISEKALAFLPKDEYYYSEVLELVLKPANIPVPLKFNLIMQGSMAVGANPQTPKEILEELAQDSDWEVRQAIACNPNAPETILKMLATDRVFTVRQEVAANPSTPVELLELLIGDKDWCVRREAIAHYLQGNSSRLQKVLECYLEKFTPAYNHFILLLHPQIPEMLLKHYSKSSVWLDRYAIASNPNTPLDTLRVLTGDANRIVRAAARANWQNSPLHL